MTQPRITDTHCHLDFPDFADDLAGVVARAGAAGVHRMITIATRVKKAAIYQELAERFENVFFSIGTHPHNAAEEPDVALEEIIRLSQHKNAWRSARPGSTITTINPRATCRRPRSGCRSRRRASPGCRL